MAASSSVSRAVSSSVSCLFLGSTRPGLPAPRSPLSTVAFARRNRKKGSLVAKKAESPDKIKQKRQPEDDGEDIDVDEDALEALFSQLEEDLKNDLSDDDDGDDEITEEDLAKLEEELGEALGDLLLNSDGTVVGEESDDEEERLPELKNWQMKRLAYALQVGRRKSSIKNLAAELGLDRSVVLEMLREPPPQLLLMSVSLPEKVSHTTYELETKEIEDSPLQVDTVPENKPEVEEPVHVKQTRWSMQKRLKKVHIETLERVYLRTKRPTNAMISSIVHVTNLPFKRVVKWFEDKRLEEGVPEQRVAFRRSVHDTGSSR